jgi:hypothetical protein
MVRLVLGVAKHSVWLDMCAACISLSTVPAVLAQLVVKLRGQVDMQSST